MKYSAEQFEALWKRFEVNVQARILLRMKNQPLTLTAANLALKETVSKWFTEYDADGSWFRQLAKDHPKEGKEIISIVKDEMKFSSDFKPKELSKTVELAVPIAASLVSGAAANYFGLSTAKQILALVVPSAVLYPAMSKTGKSIAEQGKKDSVKYYMDELRTYKERILQLLPE